MNLIEEMKKAILDLPEVKFVDIQENKTPEFNYYTQMPMFSVRIIVEGGKKKDIGKVISLYRPLGARLMGNTKVKIKEYSVWSPDVIAFERIKKV